MKVAVDVTPLEQTRAGTARYLRALLPRVERTVTVERRHGFSRGKAGTLWLDLVWYPHVLPHAARDADVLHCPTYRAPVRSRVPVVVTVHDLAVFRLPEVFPPWMRTYSRVVVPRVVRNARIVAAVSEFTANEVETLLGVPRDRIRVVPNAVETSFAADGPRADGDYLLAVGTLEPRKNLARSIEAAQRLGVELRVAGATGWGGVEATGPGVTWVGFASDDELARLYRGAACVVYPSLYEGFGIPVLEAMGAGLPVIAGNRSALPEVCGDAALMVDPACTDELAGAITRIIDEPGLREELARRGREHVRSRTWAAAAEQTWRVYQELL